MSIPFLNFNKMKSKIITLIILATSVLYSCKEVSKKEAKQETVDKKVEVIVPPKIEMIGDLKVLNFEALKPYLEKQDDKTHVINFWATWCKPCVEELPAFEKLHAENKDNNIEVLLVSLDFPNEIETQLIPFIKDNKLDPEVVVLDDPNQNKWINGVDKSWSGAIPATVIYNKKERGFFERSFTYEELNSELQKFLN